MNQKCLSFFNNFSIVNMRICNKVDSCKKQKMIHLWVIVKSITQDCTQEEADTENVLGQQGLKITHHSTERKTGFESRFMRRCFFSTEVVRRKFLIRKAALDEMIGHNCQHWFWCMEMAGTVDLRILEPCVIEHSFCNNLCSFVIDLKWLLQQLQSELQHQLRLKWVGI